MPSFLPHLKVRSTMFQRALLPGALVVSLMLFISVLCQPRWMRRGDGSPELILDHNIKPITQDAASEHARVGKITILYGDDNHVYERALRTHKLHNRMHGYSMFVQRDHILDGYWTKPAYILSILLRELSKPKSQRLEWLWWFDIDTVILNYLTPLEAFLPSTTEPEQRQVNVITNDDFNGLNNGVFAVRVHPSAVELFAGVLAYRDLRANESLAFQDQTAMEKMLAMRKYKPFAAKVPQRWFNTYADVDPDDLSAYHVRPGDLVVHFAGVYGDARRERMTEWAARSERQSDVWNVPACEATYPTDVDRFWGEYVVERRKTRAAWLRGREQLVEFNATAQETRVSAVAGGASPESLEAFDRAAVRGAKYLEETADYKDADAATEDVDSLHAVLIRFERASTALRGAVAQGEAEDAAADA